jgi:methylated-DNA-[protein]-cysteine S-methyltransferase
MLKIDISESYVINSAVGNLSITIVDQKLANINFSQEQKPCAKLTGIAVEVYDQLQRYFADPKFEFDLPLLLNGTIFQQRIWRELNKIPVGTVVTYKQMADQFNTSPRVVGNFCRENPVPIVIPCHRVVAKNSCGGYGGKITDDMLSIKKWLLKHEGFNL